MTGDSYIWSQLASYARTGHSIWVHQRKRTASVDGFPDKPITGRIPPRANAAIDSIRRQREG